MRIANRLIGPQEFLAHPDLPDTPSTLFLLFCPSPKPPRHLLSWLSAEFRQAHIVAISCAAHIPEMPIQHTRLVGIHLDRGHFAVETTEELTTSGSPNSAALSYALMDAGEPKGVIYMAPPFGEMVGDRPAVGISAVLGERIPAIGTIASRPDDLHSGWVWCQGSLIQRGLVGIGIYGDVTVRTSARSGHWYSPRDRARRVTAMVGAWVTELDGHAALSVALRDTGWGKPGKGTPQEWHHWLREFPWGSGQEQGGEPHVLRSVVAVDHRTLGIQFGGGMRVGDLIRLANAGPKDYLSSSRAMAQEISGARGQGVLIVAQCAARLGSPHEYPVPTGTEVVGMFGGGELGPRPRRLCHLNHHVVGMWVGEG